MSFSFHYNSVFIMKYMASWSFNFEYIVQVLAILMLSDFTYVQKPLVLEEAFNQNMLATFLLVRWTLLVSFNLI